MCFCPLILLYPVPTHTTTQDSNTHTRQRFSLAHSHQSQSPAPKHGMKTAQEELSDLKKHLNERLLETRHRMCLEDTPMFEQAQHTPQASPRPTGNAAYHSPRQQYANGHQQPPSPPSVPQYVPSKPRSPHAQPTVYFPVKEDMTLLAHSAQTRPTEKEPHAPLRAGHSTPRSPRSVHRAPSNPPSPQHVPQHAPTNGHFHPQQQHPQHHQQQQQPQHHHHHHQQQQPTAPQQQYQPQQQQQQQQHYQQYQPQQQQQHYSEPQVSPRHVPPHAPAYTAPMQQQHQQQHQQQPQHHQHHQQHQQQQQHPQHQHGGYTKMAPNPSPQRHLPQQNSNTMPQEAPQRVQHHHHQHQQQQQQPRPQHANTFPPQSDRDCNMDTPPPPPRPPTPQKRDFGESLSQLRNPPADNAHEFNTFLQSCSTTRDAPVRQQATPPPAFLTRPPDRPSTVSPSKAGNSAYPADKPLPDTLEQDLPELNEDSDQSLHPCRHCGRSFKTCRIEKHESVCDKGKLQHAQMTPRKSIPSITPVTPRSSVGFRTNIPGKVDTGRPSTSKKPQTPKKKTSVRSGSDDTTSTARFGSFGSLGSFTRLTSVSAEHPRRVLATPRNPPRGHYERCGTLAKSEKTQEEKSKPLRERPSARVNEAAPRGGSVKANTNGGSTRSKQRRGGTPPPQTHRGVYEVMPAVPTTPPQQKTRKPDTPPAAPPTNPSPQRDMTRMNKLEDARRRMKEGHKHGKDAARIQIMQEIEESLLTPRRVRRGDSPARSVSPEIVASPVPEKEKEKEREGRGREGRADTTRLRELAADLTSKNARDASTERSYLARRAQSRESRDRREPFENTTPKPSPSKVCAAARVSHIKRADRKSVAVLLRGDAFCYVL